MSFQLCNYFNYVFLNFCFSDVGLHSENGRGQNGLGLSRFNVFYEWTHLNYTWESDENYVRALQSGAYIPENNAPVGMKIYNDVLYLSIPRFRDGIPATLVSVEMNSWIPFQNPPLLPYPNWSAHTVGDCFNFQSVQSMEIDTMGIMWVIDGVRINNITNCPTKVVLLDLNNGGKIVRSYVFPNEISLRDGGFLNDLVIDETDGGYAYITDNSAIDPGIIVYSKKLDRSWKLRDVSMFPEPKGSNFPVEKYVFDARVPVDGIALSPANKDGNKRIYFCALTSFTLYSLSTRILQDESEVKSGRWRERVISVGRKISQTDGIIIDEQSTMYLTLLPFYGVAKWNINKPIWTSRIVDSNKNTMIWPDGFAFDQKGFLYVISNKVYNYIDSRNRPEFNGDVQFRILRFFTGTRSYLYG